MWFPPVVIGIRRGWRRKRVCGGGAVRPFRRARRLPQGHWFRQPLVPRGPSLAPGAPFAAARMINGSLVAGGLWMPFAVQPALGVVVTGVRAAGGGGPYGGAGPGAVYSGGVVGGTHRSRPTDGHRCRLPCSRAGWVSPPHPSRPAAVPPSPQGKGRAAGVNCLGCGRKACTRLRRPPRLRDLPLYRYILHPFWPVRTHSYSTPAWGNRGYTTSRCFRCGW